MKVYTVTVTWPNGKIDVEEFEQRGAAVAYQIDCIKKGAKATVSKL